MPKERTYLWIIASLLIIIVFVQVTGHLSLTNGAIEDLFNVLASKSPNDYNLPAKYIHSVILTPFKILKWLGIKDFKYYVYVFCLIFSLIPFLSLSYFASKKSHGDHAFVIPLIGMSLIFAVLDLHLFSESILGITLFVIFMGVIHYSENQMNISEKIFFVTITPLVVLTGWSFVFLVPFIWTFAWIKRSSTNRLFLLILCVGMIPWLIYLIYLIFQSEITRKFLFHTFHSKLNAKYLFFAVVSHFLLLGSLFFARITKTDWKALILGLTLVFYLTWFDWAISVYIYQRFQADNLMLVTLFIGVITFLCFLNIKKISLNCFYPFLILCLMISFFTQSHRKLMIARSFLGLYEACSHVDNNYMVDESLLAGIYSDVGKLPSLSRSACLMRNKNAQTIFNTNGRSVPTGNGLDDSLIQNIENFISTENTMVIK